MIERDLTSTRMQDIRHGDAPEATRGDFDLAHLKAIHAYTFQDVYEWAGVTRGETMTIEGNSYQASALLFKGEESEVSFVPSSQVNASLERTFDQLRQDDHLKGLSREEFADRAATVFSEINAAHAFMEGNGRTQREFLMQLGEQAGHPLNFDVVSGYRMDLVSEQARLGDQEGMQRLFQEISDPARVALLEHAERVLTEKNFNWDDAYIVSATPGEHYSGMKVMHNPETLIIREDREFVLVAQTSDVPPQERRADFTASPYPQAQVEAQAEAQPVSLKGLSQDEFAQRAAQRLAATVQAGDLSPAQVREAAQQLAAEGERRINLNVITQERLSRDVEAARQGQTQGFERLFQETTQGATVQLMQRAMHTLEIQGRDPQALYLTATQAGQVYEGQVESKTSRAVIVADGEGRHLVTPPASLKQATTLEAGRVQFTAQDSPKSQDLLRSRDESQ